MSLQQRGVCPMALGKNVNDKSDSAACVYQVVRIKASSQKRSAILRVCYLGNNEGSIAVAGR